MSYYAKVKVQLIDSDTGALISTGATIKYGFSGSANVAIDLDKVITVNPSDKNTSLIVGATMVTNYTFNKFTADIRQFYDDGMLIMGTTKSSTNPGVVCNLADFISNATSEERATEVDVKCYISYYKKKLHYDANGGTGAPADQEFTAGTSFTLSATAPTKTGSTFQGWNVAGTTTKYAKSASVNFQHNTTLYAMWTATDYQKDAYYGALVYKV